MPYGDHGTPRSSRPGQFVSRRSIESHAINEVVVLEVAGRLDDVVEELDRAILLALAEGPRGVVCDLSAVHDDVVDPTAVQVLARAGRHVRDWPGIPIAVACPDPRIRKALSAHALGGRLILTASITPAVSAVLVTPKPAVEWLTLAPHPTAPRAARNFASRTLLDWSLGRIIPSAALVISELVTNVTLHAPTDIDLSIAWNRKALRLTVRDHSPAMPRLSHSELELGGRGLVIVAALTRVFGVLPTADGGKVVWAVIPSADETHWSEETLAIQPA